MWLHVFEGVILKIDIYIYSVQPMRDDGITETAVNQRGVDRTGRVELEGSCTCMVEEGWGRDEKGHQIGCVINICEVALMSKQHIESTKNIPSGM